VSRLRKPGQSEPWDAGEGGKQPRRSLDGLDYQTGRAGGGGCRRSLASTGNPRARIGALQQSSKYDHEWR
jgi:hypothetical protein